MTYSSLSYTKTPTNILVNLRKLVPLKQHTVQEAYNLAALQAKHFQEMSDSSSPEFPYQAINDQPKIFIAYAPYLPVDGSAHWNGKTWVIVLNSSEPRLRQRFNLAHEFKHILDHTTKQYLYPGKDALLSGLLAEAVADYFAICLLNS